MTKTIQAGRSSDGRANVTLSVWHKGRLTRFGVGVVPRGSEGVKVAGGPREPGPWAFAFEKCGVIAARREDSSSGERDRELAAGREHDVADGDTVVIDGDRYTVRVNHVPFQTFLILEAE